MPGTSRVTPVETPRLRNTGSAATHIFNQALRYHLTSGGSRWVICRLSISGPVRCALSWFAATSERPVLINGGAVSISEFESGRDAVSDCLEDGGVFVEEVGDVGACEHGAQFDSELARICVCW